MNKKDWPRGTLVLYLTWSMHYGTKVKGNKELFRGELAMAQRAGDIWNGPWTSIDFPVEKEGPQ